MIQPGLMVLMEPCKTILFSWKNQQLWIEGQISGKQTWGCADTIYIVGDITYDGTLVGDPPDEDPVNMTDYFGLVSEKKDFNKV